jgi:hypothetical protein
MTHDRRQSISRSFFVLQTVALAVGLAGIDKAFEEVEQYVGRAGNEAGKTVEQANNAASEGSAAADRHPHNSALAARMDAALNVAPGHESFSFNVTAPDGLVTLAGSAENATKRDHTKRPRIER